MFYSPHLFVGFLFLVLYPVRVLLLLRARFVTHTQLCHTHTRLVAGDATALWVAGVALGDIHLPLRGRGGTWRHQPSFLRGRRGTWRHRRCVCVAGRHLWHSLTHTTLSRTTLSFVWRGRRGTCSNAFTHTTLSFTQTSTHSSFTCKFVTHTSLSRTNLNTHTHFHTQLFHT